MSKSKTALLTAHVAKRSIEVARIMAQFEGMTFDAYVNRALAFQIVTDAEALGHNLQAEFEPVYNGPSSVDAGGGR